MNIEMKGIDKSFGTNQVLKNAGFSTDGKEIKKDFGPRYEYFYTFENTEKEQ